MAKLQPASKEKQDTQSKESRHKKMATQSIEDQLLALDEGIIDYSIEPLLERHAALLADSGSDEQRAGIATQLQQAYGNIYVQRIMEHIQAGNGIISRDSATQRPDEETTSTTQSPTSETSTSATQAPTPETSTSATQSPTPETSSAATQAPTPETRSTHEAPAGAEPAPPSTEATAETESTVTSETATEAGPSTPPPESTGETESTATPEGELVPAIELERRAEMERLRTRWETWAIQPAQRAHGFITARPPNYAAASNYLTNSRYELESIISHPRVPDEVKERVRLARDSLRLTDQTLITLQQPNEEINHRIEEFLRLIRLEHIYGEVEGT